MKRFVSVLLCVMLLLTACASAGDQHQYKFVKYVNATCTEGDYSIYKCELCGETMRVDGRIGPLGHSFSWTVVEPTCTQEGTRTGVCDRCGHTWTGTDPALGHDWGEWTVIQEPTDDQPGIRQRVCSRGDATEQEYFDKDGNVVPEPEAAVDPVYVCKEVISTPANGTAYAAGEDVVYRFTITNKTARDILIYELSDWASHADGVYSWTVSCIETTNVSEMQALPAYGTITYDCTYTVTEADAQAGYVKDYAQVRWQYADNADEKDASCSNFVLVDCCQMRSLTITKRLDSAPANGEYFTLGEKLYFSADIANNTGRDILLTSVMDNDAGGSWYIWLIFPDVGNGDGTITLPEGETVSLSFWYTITDHDILNGNVSDVVTAEGHYVDDMSETVSASSNVVTAICKGEAHEPRLVKSVDSMPANGSFYTEGETVTYTFEVINEADEVLSGVTVYDEFIGTSSSLGAVDGCSNASVSFDYVVNAADCEAGSLYNFGYMTATADDGSQYYIESNPVSVPTGVEAANTVGCEVKKQIISVSAQGNNVYGVGETVRCLISVTNTGDVALILRDVKDVMLLGEGPYWLDQYPNDTLEPGKTLSYMFEYTLTESDCALGEVYDSAYVAYETIDDVDGEAMSGECVIYTTTDTVDAEDEGATLIKYEVSTPKNGSYYTEGETVSFAVVFTNSDEMHFNLKIYDVLSTEPGYLIYTASAVNPGETVVAQMDYVVTALDADVLKSVTNTAWAEASGVWTGVNVTSNEVTVPCGNAADMAAIYQGGSCVKTLVATGNGAELIRTDMCAAHYTLELKAQAMDDKTEIADMWQRNVMYMYEALFAATGDEAFTTDRSVFLTEINVLRQLVGDEGLDMIIDILRERATELCCELSGLERKDSALNAEESALPEAQSNFCSYTARDGSGSWYDTETVTAGGHQMVQASADKLLAAIADNAEYSQEVLVRVNALWQNALKGEYSALDQNDSAYAADGELFIAELESRKNALSVIYPDDPDLVSALIIRELRNRVILLCGINQ